MTMGGLKVFVKEGNDTEKEVWGKSGDQGDQWLNSNKTITSKKPYKVSCFMHAFTIIHPQ